MGKSGGGDGGRVVNVASLAGLLTGLGPIDLCGYTLAKWGCVAMTRDGRGKDRDMELVCGGRTN